LLVACKSSGGDISRPNRHLLRRSAKHHYSKWSVRSMTDPEHDSNPTQPLGSISRWVRRLYAIPAEKACSCPFTEDMPIPSEASEKGAFLPTAANLLIEKDARDGCNVVIHIILIECEISMPCPDGVTIITADLACMRWPKSDETPWLSQVLAVEMEYES